MTLPTVETFVVGPDIRTCDEIRVEFSKQAREKADHAFAAGDDLHGVLWLQIGEWIDREARVQP